MKKISITLLTIAISFQLMAQTTNDFFTKTNMFLKTHVSNGKVAYDDIYKNQATLKELMTIAKNIKVDKSDENLYRAFWINAYNLTIIKGVIDSYPIDSPLKVPGFFDKISYELGGVKTTLNNIEHVFLRGNFNFDPRFHFVLVCGAIGCPPLINEAYLPNTLENQLTTQTKLAVNGTYFLTVNDQKKRIEGSEILKWYKGDFTLNKTTEIDFINKYRTQKIPSNYKITYTVYNWNLNKK